MIANKWYCIAQTGTFDSGCTINVSFDSYVIQFSASVKYGSSAINITRCELPLSANLSLRLRESNGLWSVDLLSNNDITPEIVVADSPYWVAVNSVAGAGNIILTLKDISKDFNTGTGGSGGGLDENELRAFLDKYGYTQARDFWKYETTGGGAIHTDYHIIVDGGGAFGGAELGGGGESGGGGISEFYIQLGEGGQKYKLGNTGLPNVVQIPKYPVVPTNVSEFYNDAGYIGGEQAALIFSRISEVEARVEKLEKLWWVDENGNLHTTYNIVVEGGGAFGTGASVDAGNSGGLGRVVLVNDSGNEYASDENGIVRIPDYVNKTWFDAQNFASQSWVLSKGYVSDSALAPIREDITSLKGDVEILKGMWTIKDGKLHTTYSIVVEGGGSFGEGSESGGGSTGGLGQITIRNQAGQEYKTDANGVVVIPTYLTSNALDGYATQAWVESKKYLTSHQDISHLLSKTDAANTYATQSALKGVSDSLGTLRTDFDNLNTLLNDDTSGVIDTWREVVDFIDEYSGSQDLATILAGMNSNIATNAANISKNATAITNVSNRVTALEAMWYIDADGNLHTKKSIVVEGGGAFGTGSASGGGGTSGGLGSVTIKTEGGIEYKSNSNGVVTVPNWITASALNGYATESYVTTRGYITGITSAMVTTALGYVPFNSTSFTKATIKSTLGIADWALAASKPSYSWSEVTGKPSFATVATSGKYSDLSGVPTSLPASDVYAWAKAATKPTYTASEVGALSTSGGTINGSLTVSRDAAVPFYVKNTQARNTINQATLRFVIGANYGAGLLGKSADSNLYRTDVSLSASYKIVDTGNYADTTDKRYLQLSGGTMQGDIVMSMGNYLRVGSAYDSYAMVGHDSSGIILGAPNLPLVLRSNGTSTINGNTLYHAGNFNPANYLPLTGGTISGNIVWYKGKWGVDTSARGVFMSWNDSNYLHITGDGAFYNWNTLIHSGNIGSYALKIDGSNAMTAPLLLAYNSSLTEEKGMYIGTTGLSGGGAFDYASFINIYDRSNSSLQLSWYRNIYVPQVAMRISENGSWSAWKTVAFTDSNVASATKLQTARTIWGQSFDGTANVSGRMSGVNTIHFGSQSYPGPGIIQGNWYAEGWTDGDVVLSFNRVHFSGNVLIGTLTDSGYKLTTAGNSIHCGGISIGANANDNWYNTFIRTVYEGQSPNYLNGAMAFYTMNNSYLDGTEVERMRLSSAGNLLIGTTTDSGYKLDVNGGSFRLCAAIASADNTVAAFYTYPNNPYGLQMRVNPGSGDTYLQARREGKAEYFNLILEPDGGNVLIGTTTDNSQKLQVRREGNGEVIGLTSNQNWASIFYGMDNGQNWSVGAAVGGKFFFNYNSVGDLAYLTSAGNLVVTGGGAFGSDVRHKDIISYRQLDLETIVNAPLFTFKWNDREDKKVYLGTSAQYWMETTFKDAVNTENPNFYHLDYGALAVGMGISVAREVKGVKTDIKGVKTEVEQLRDEVKQLKEKLNKYEQIWHN